MSADSLCATQHVLSLAQPSPMIPGQKFLRLNLTDPLQHRFFMDRFGVIEGQPLGPAFPTRAELAAHLARPEVANAALARPMLHMLTSPPLAGTFAPVAYITAFNYDQTQVANSSVTARAILSIPAGFQLACVALEIFENEACIGFEGALSVAQHTVLATTTANLTNAGDGVTAVFSGIYIAASEVVPFAVTAAVSPQPLLSITVGDPVHKVTNPGSPITVAIGRIVTPPGQADTDYYLWPNHPGNPIELLLTVDGSAASSSPSNTFTPGQTVTGSLVLVKPQGANPGGGTVIFPGTINDLCTVLPNRLDWNFDTSGEYGTVTDFGTQAPWSPGDTILMTLNLTATMTTPQGAGQAVTITVTSSSSVPEPMQNTCFIDALQFYWGCVSGSALVRLPDGTERPLCDVGPGDRVQGPDGRVFVVSRYKIGVEDAPLVELVTTGAARVRVTDGHPVLTPHGPRVARSLTVGESIVTIRGSEAITSAARVVDRDPVYNLVLACEDGSLPDAAAFFAGGVLVGDDAMQAAVEQAANEAAARRQLDSLLASNGNGCFPAVGGAAYSDPHTQGVSTLADR